MTPLAQPAPVWALVALALVFGAVGWRTGRDLATGGYRIPEDEATHLPAHPWWVAPALAALAVFVGWHLGDAAGWAAAPAYLLFAWLTVALVWIDLDVHRLPVGLVVPAMPLLAVLLALASLGDGGRRWLGALVGALVIGGFYLVLAFLPGGGVGGGDVRLAPVVGAMLGWLGPAALVVGTLATAVIGGLAALALLVTGRAGAKTPIAYGPPMCLGVFVALGFTSQIMAALTGG